MHFRFCIVTLSLLCSFVSTAYAEGQFLPLKLDRTFMNTSKGVEETPAFITAQHIEGQADNQVTATGEVELRKRGQAIFADHVVYKESDQELVADGGGAHRTKRHSRARPPPKPQYRYKHRRHAKASIPDRH